MFLNKAEVSASYKWTNIYLCTLHSVVTLKEIIQVPESSTEQKKKERTDKGNQAREHENMKIGDTWQIQCTGRLVMLG
jgi:hypothetical protein